MEPWSRYRLKLVTTVEVRGFRHDPRVVGGSSRVAAREPARRRGCGSVRGKLGQDARILYNIHRWGAGYFDVNDGGHVVARPLMEAGAAVELSDIVEETRANLNANVLKRLYEEELPEKVSRKTWSAAKSPSPTP